MNQNSRYILYKRVARGGMAEIYLGKHIGEDHFQRVCCIKRILPHYAQEHEFVEMFRDEAHICKSLQHANIVRVEGFEEVEGSYAIIMEFINGGDLRTVLSTCEKSGERISVPISVYMAAEAARGLHYAHTKRDEITGKELGIVHRDISPQNILISFEGEVKVTDFGIADAESKETETKPGIVKGKYSYMSPEQITAQAVDARTDVFALGIILWESLAMRRLFHAENEIEIIQMVRNCKISYDIATLNPEVDEQLQQILSKALAKNPDDRYSSAAAFEKDLRYYINQHYADFTTQDLALFMKRLLNKRKEEVAKDIKELLSQAIAESAKTSPPIEQKKETPKVSPQVAAAVKAPLKTETPGTGIKQGAFSLDKNNYGNRAGSWSGPAYTNAHKTRVNSAWDAKSSPSSSSSFAKFVFFVIAMVGIFLGGFYYYQKTQSGKEPGNLNLSTIPDTVLLTLDDLALFEGKYINTPIALKRIPIGRHLLKITRVGFAEEVLDIDIRGGETLTRNNIVLKATTQMAPVRVFLEPGSKQGLKINIADGLIETNVSPSDPLNLDSLPFGQIYNLRVYPDLSDNSRYFDCRFVPRAQNWKAPYLVMIEPGRQKCSFPLR